MGGAKQGRGGSKKDKNDSGTPCRTKKKGGLAGAARKKPPRAVQVRQRLYKERFLGRKKRSPGGRARVSGGGRRGQS